MSAMKPSIGRIVHYVDSDLTHHAAVITRVHGGTVVNLHVFWAESIGASPVRTQISMGDLPFAGTWHWPERE